MKNILNQEGLKEMEAEIEQTTQGRKRESKSESKSTHSTICEETAKVTKAEANPRNLEPSPLSSYSLSTRLCKEACGWCVCMRVVGV